MPDSRPDAADLAEIVRDWIREQVLPRLEGDARFQGLIAVSLLGMVAREIRLKPAADAAERARLAALTGAAGGDGEGEGVAVLNRRLCAMIEEGAIALDDPALLAHLAASLRDALAISNPRWLRPADAERSAAPQ